MVRTVRGPSRSSNSPVAGSTIVTSMPRRRHSSTITWVYRFSPVSPAGSIASSLASTTSGDGGREPRCALDQPAEQCLARARVTEELGMPLHADEPVVVGGHHRLDRPLLRAGGDRETAPEVVDRLVVQAVDLHARGAEDGREGRPGLDRDRVHGLASPRVVAVV